jgi:RimJ/RimL family protein N-acetyltransferase
MEPVGETLRLRIVPFLPGDTEFLYRLTGDTDVMKHFTGVLSYDETSQMLRKILDQYQRHGYCFWKVVSKENEKFIGIAGLLRQEIENEIETEISYRIARELWNNGYATEAAKACLEYAKTKLKKTRIISIIHPQNHASIRVAQKLGAPKEKSVAFIGNEHDVYVY